MNSEIKANILLDHFKTPWKIIQAICGTHIEYTKGGTPKGISGSFTELNGFGHKYITENQKIFKNPF